MSKKDKKKDEGKDDKKQSKKKVKSPKKKSTDNPIPKDVDFDSFNLSSEPNFVPQFIKNFVDDIHRKHGVQFETINIRVVGEDDLDTLPKEILTHILNKAVDQENYELASKVRDVINNK